MKIGLQIPYFKYGGDGSEIGPKLAEIGLAAEEAGFYSVWVMDHFLQLNDLGPLEDPMLEGYSTLTYLAAHTERVKLGTLVTGVVYRHPGFLIKAATTLDVLSGGRAYFGVGAAWYATETRALGFPFPPRGVRFEWLEETLQIAKQMWSQNDGAYEGKHFKLEQTVNGPQAISKPHPPIMIGGVGEKKTLRMAAQYADACNLFYRGDGDVDVVRHKLEVLRQHCDNLGRDYADVEKTVLAPLFNVEPLPSAEELIEICKKLAALGIQHVIFNIPATHTLKPLEMFGQEVIPAVAEL